MLHDDFIKEGLALFTKLNINNEYWTPKLVNNGYSIYLSDRSRGKTTNVLLFYMCIAWVTNSCGCYIRNRSTMLTQARLTTLFSVINMFDYVSIITNERYTSVVYDRTNKTFSYYNAETDETSDVFLYCLAIDKQEDYKSTLNLPTCIYCILDEFINYNHIVNEVVEFFQLLKTIYRERDTCFITLLANTVELNDLYFHEFCIYNYVKLMRFGDKKTITTPKGTTVYIEILDEVKETAKKKRSLINKLLFGFDNPKLASITGESSTWDIKQYRHIENTANDKILDTRFVEFYDDIVRLDLIKNNDGLFVHCYKFNYVFNDSTVLTNNLNNYNKNAFRRLRNNKLNKLYVRLYRFNKYMYSTNDIGYIIEQIFKENGVEF